MSKFVKIYHNDSTIRNLKELFERNKIVTITPKDFLDVGNNNDINRNRLFKALTAQDRVNFNIGSASDLTADSFIRTPVELFLPVEYATLDLLIEESNFKVNNDNYEAFIDDKIFKILNSPEFVQKNVSKSIPRASVWIWCKSVGQVNDFIKGEKDTDNSLFDLSPFILSLQTSVAETGGNFQLTLAPIQAIQSSYKNNSKPEHDNKGVWGVELNQIHTYKQDNGEQGHATKINVNKAINVDAVVQIDDGTKTPVDKYTDSKRVASFFTNLISENDLVFIQFEKLPDASDNEDDNLYIQHSELPGRVYDMIALVDTNEISFTAETTDLVVNITGRDLMKVLLDDGSFFFQNSFANPDSRFSVFANAEIFGRGDGVSASNNLVNDNKSAFRLDGSGIIDTLFLSSNRTINFVLNLLVNKLANIEICPSNLFEFYPDADKTQIQIEGRKNSTGNATYFDKKEMLTENE